MLILLLLVCFRERGGGRYQEIMGVIPHANERKQPTNKGLAHLGRPQSSWRARLRLYSLAQLCAIYSYLYTVHTAGPPAVGSCKCPFKPRLEFLSHFLRYRALKQKHPAFQACENSTLQIHIKRSSFPASSDPEIQGCGLGRQKHPMWALGWNL